MDVHSLFELEDTTKTTVPPIETNPDNRHKGETYQQWGTRICGVVSGSLMALPPCLQKVRNEIYAENAHNQEMLDQAKENIKTKIALLNDEIKTINEKIEESNDKIKEVQQKNDSLKEERRQIEAGKEIVNKEQRVRMVIGLVILIPLTVYLFMFYSSTFYSAFFREAETLTNVMNTMFDAQTFAHAYSQGGLYQLMFVLSAPVIFLGLGYVLHIFSMAQERIKYLKMAAILSVTLLFDSILAYKIGDQMHSLGIIVGTYPVGEEYTVAMAFKDVNTWAVIFCGFIVYVIWGFVFDMIMSAYSKMDIKKARMTAIDADLQNNEEKIANEKKEVSAMKTQIKSLEAKIHAMTGKLGSDVIVNVVRIKNEMNNFFLGWIKMMTVLSIEQKEQEEAKRIFESELNGLLNDNTEEV